MIYQIWNNIYWYIYFNFYK